MHENIRKLEAPHSRLHFACTSPGELGRMNLPSCNNIINTNNHEDYHYYYCCCKIYDAHDDISKLPANKQSSQHCNDNTKKVALEMEPQQQHHEDCYTIRRLAIRGDRARDKFHESSGYHLTSCLLMNASQIKSAMMIMIAMLAIAIQPELETRYHGGSVGAAVAAIGAAAVANFFKLGYNLSRIRSPCYSVSAAVVGALIGLAYAGDLRRRGRAATGRDGQSPRAVMTARSFLKNRLEPIAIMLILLSASRQWPENATAAEAAPALEMPNQNKLHKQEQQQQQQQQEQTIHAANNNNNNNGGSSYLLGRANEQPAKFIVNIGQKILQSHAAAKSTESTTNNNNDMAGFESLTVESPRDFGVAPRLITQNQSNLVNQSADQRPTTTIKANYASEPSLPSDSANRTGLANPRQTERVKGSVAFNLARVESQSDNIVIRRRIKKHEQKSSWQEIDADTDSDSNSDSDLEIDLRVGTTIQMKPDSTTSANGIEEASSALVVSMATSGQADGSSRDADEKSHLQAGWQAKAAQKTTTTITTTTTAKTMVVQELNPLDGAAASVTQFPGRPGDAQTSLEQNLDSNREQRNSDLIPISNNNNNTNTNLKRDQTTTSTNKAEADLLLLPSSSSSSLGKQEAPLSFSAMHEAPLVARSSAVAEAAAAARPQAFESEPRATVVESSGVESSATKQSRLILRILVCGLLISVLLSLLLVYSIKYCLCKRKKSRDNCDGSGVGQILLFGQRGDLVGDSSLSSASASHQISLQSAFNNCNLHNNHYLRHYNSSSNHNDNNNHLHHQQQQLIGTSASPLHLSMYRLLQQATYQRATSSTTMTPSVVSPTHQLFGCVDANYCHLSMPISQNVANRRVTANAMSLNQQIDCLCHLTNPNSFWRLNMNDNYHSCHTDDLCESYHEELTSEYHEFHHRCIPPPPPVTLPSNSPPPYSSLFGTSSLPLPLPPPPSFANYDIGSAQTTSVVPSYQLTNPTVQTAIRIQEMQNDGYPSTTTTTTISENNNNNNDDDQHNNNNANDNDCSQQRLLTMQTSSVSSCHDQSTTNSTSSSSSGDEPSNSSSSSSSTTLIVKIDLNKTSLLSASDLMLVSKFIGLPDLLKVSKDNNNNSNKDTNKPSDQGKIS